MKKKWLALLFALIMGLTIGVSQASAEIMISPGTIGDVLLFSLYDVREDADFRTAYWDNFLVIENTSGNWTAVHLRFRAYKKSIEVWDHVILLSPYDMFWADIHRTAGTGGVTIWSDDENTLRNSGLYYGTPAPSGHLWEDNFKTDLMVACGFADDLAETEYGEIEVIGLWSLSVPVADPGDLTKLPNGVEDTHTLSDVVRDLYNGTLPDVTTPEPVGTVNVYDLMFGLYYEWAPPYAPPAWYGCSTSPLDHSDTAWNAGWETYLNANVLINACEAPQIFCSNNVACDGVEREALDCGNILTGAFEMGDVGNGRYELQNFVVLRDFRTDTVDGRGEINNGFHLDRFGGGEIVFPPTVMSNVMSVATYTRNPITGAADGRFSGAVTNIPAYYLNSTWTSTYGAGLNHGDNVIALNSPVVAPFNNIWSLDDVENAIAKTSVWFHYFNDFLYTPGVWDYRYITDISISFPTKHFHWFFNMWPWWQQFYAAETPAEYFDDVTQYRRIIANNFEEFFDNGRIYADSKIWDDNEDLYTPDPITGPSPITHENVIIPHEVNYIRVQETDPDGLLYIDPTEDYTIGHFQILNIRVANGMRNIGFGPGMHPIYRPTIAMDYALYPVGAVTFLNFAVDATGAPNGLIRSTLSNWHYVWAAIHPWTGTW